MLHCASLQTRCRIRGNVVRRIAIALVFLAAVPSFAAELGRAVGAVTVDKEKIDLQYAYAVGRQRNEITSRKDDVKVVLTNKPLSPDVKLSEIDYNFPDGVYGVVVHIASNKKVTHVVVQHLKGSYDGGFFEESTDYRFRDEKGGRGVIMGSVSYGKVQTNTMTFSLDAAFNALVQ